MTKGNGLFVGRNDLLSEVKGIVSATKEGEGKTLALSGEAGVGKTTLVERSMVDIDGLSHSKGWCLPESGAPLLPFREALKTFGMEDSLTWEAPPKLDSIFLVTKDGIPVAKFEREATGLDADIFSSMLSAVSSFVDDSMTLHDEKSRGKGQLSGLEYGDYKVVIESKPMFSLVSLIRGKDNELLRADMRDLLESVSREFSGALEEWDGDLSLFEDAETEIQELVVSGRYDGVDHLENDPEMKRPKIFESVLEGLKRRSLEKPLVIFIDDLQWADDSTLSLIHYLSRNVKELPILLIGTFREEEVEEGGPLKKMLRLMSREGIVELLRVPRLADDDSRLLIRSLLKGEGPLSEELVDEINGLTGGNPFFILETVDYVKEKGATKLPPRVVDVVLRRLEALDEEEKEFLELASVFGMEFDPDFISGMLGLKKLRKVRLLRTLTETSKLVKRKEEQMSFDHPGLKEAIYESIPVPTRKDYHLVIAETLEEERPSSVFMTAHHYFKSGSKRAVKYLLKSADVAKKQFANMEAHQFYEQALTLLSPSEERFAQIAYYNAEVLEIMGELEACINAIEDKIDRVQGEYLGRLLTLKGSVEIRMGKLKASFESLTEAEEVLSEGTPAYRELLGAFGVYHYRQGNFEEGRDYLQKRLENTPEDDLQGFAEAYRNLGALEFYSGELDKAIENWKKAYETYDSLKLVRKAAQMSNNIGLVARDKGDNKTALKWTTDSMKIFDKIGDKKGLGASYNNLAIISYRLGNFSYAMEMVDKAMGVFERIGDIRSIAETMQNKGLISIYQKDISKALELFQESGEIFEKMKDASAMARVHYNRAEVYSLLLNDKELRKSIEGMEKVNEEVNIPQLSAGIVLGRSIEMMMRGDTENAVKSLEGLKENLDSVNVAEAYAKTLVLLSLCHLSQPGEEKQGRALAEKSFEYLKARTHRVMAIHNLVLMNKLAKRMNVVIPQSVTSIAREFIVQNPESAKSLDRLVELSD